MALPIRKHAPKRFAFSRNVRSAMLIWRYSCNQETQSAGDLPASRMAEPHRASSGRMAASFSRSKSLPTGPSPDSLPASPNLGSFDG